MADPEKPNIPDDHAPLRLETGPYILRSLIRDVALSAGGEESDVRITCVEIWKENLYIGTSAGEILHHVQIPPDLDDPSSSAVFILASRLKPPVNQQTGAGIQQILLLPAVNKACILSNNTLNFYQLPELSPAFPQLRPLTCGWVGGVDISEDEGTQNEMGSVAIMMCLRNKIRIVKIGEQASRERDIEFGGCLATVRRGNIACVADARSYALVDVAHQQKIPLLPISSLDEQTPEAGTGTLQDEMWPTSAGVSRSNSSAGTSANRLSVQDRGHSRSTSLGVFRTDSSLGDAAASRPTSVASRYGFDAPTALSRQASPKPPISPERRGSEGAGTTNLSKPLPATPVEAGSNQASAQTSPTKTFIPLKPIIVSPSDSEFLLVTGTAPTEPGVGMFVNLDGEVTRGSMEFGSFPEYLVVDGKGMDMSLSTSLVDPEAREEGYTLSVIRREVNGSTTRDVEIQRWDVDPGEGGTEKEWLGVASRHHGLSTDAINSLTSLGIRQITQETEFDLPEITEKLAPKAFQLVPKDDPDLEKIAKREKEEKAYHSRLAKTKSRITLWAGNEVHWTLRNPLVLRLDARLRLAQSTSIEKHARIAPQRGHIEALLNDLRGLRSSNELDFFSLSYIRQKAAMLLFFDLLLQTASNKLAFEHDIRATGEALVESEIDPRFVLYFLPGIASEILQSPEGIWIQGGLKEIMETFIAQFGANQISEDPSRPFRDNLLYLTKRYLTLWRKKKGNPSVTDGAKVFPTIDAALLHILLILDTSSPRGPASAGSIRSELNATVDAGVDCFERAIQLLEKHKRLYILSRLYQSRKMSKMVLETWKRIIAGDEDLGGEFGGTEGEGELKVYLTKLRNRSVVEEYGTWLANRNPKLGVQVFADDSARTAWSPSEALALLRKRAPGAVKEYLEYLVFAKKQTQHINELIAYYLDNVIDELKSSNDARAILMGTYETYRALKPPKPTYRHFIEDNSTGDEWWHSRLRLLQLLGGTQGASGSYDVETVLKRLEPFEKELVPEMIILNGRQGRHQEAIRLLTHGLGDFDMAISYCLRGGSSVYASPTTQTPEDTERQSSLFKTLLSEFLRIEDVGDRIERSGELLERFGGWFEVEYVLSVLPDGWSVEIFGGFLISALRRIVRERNETRVVRALRGAENLSTAVEKVERIEDLGSVIERTVEAG